jgi:hypothetical protein
MCLVSTDCTIYFIKPINEKKALRNYVSWLDKNWEWKRYVLLYFYNYYI